MSLQFIRSFVILSVIVLFAPLARAEEALPIVLQVAAQPLKAQAKRIAQALELLGQPLSEKQQLSLQKAIQSPDDLQAIKQIQQVFDPLCLVRVNVNAESRVKVSAGAAQPKLVQQGWSVYLVKVHNEAGVTSALRMSSPNAEPLHKRSTGSASPKRSIKPYQAANRWLDLSSYSKQPLTEKLSGLEVEYRIVELYSRDVGQREAKLLFDVGQGTQDLGFRNEINLLFQCVPAVEVALDIFDEDGTPTTAQLVFRDEMGRVYPSRSRRIAPDFFFHDQIYRHSGESITLPPGDYEVSFSRGPEYIVQSRHISVPDAKSHKETFHLKRWIRMTDHNWYSGDHHVHAAGCAHYESPAEGVTPADMMRHILGEDLNVGCVLSWGPCWYFQKQFFEGEVSKLSTANYLMRYDVEVSGFPSSHSGHLCLLRLKEDDYPGTSVIDEWPSWDLPVLKWGKEQGGVVGFSHSGWGLEINATSLPTFEMPPFDGIGANEYIVDVTHNVCDFISAVDTPSVWELNIWYHTLNCGYTCRISGETDFPCIYGERVGLGRSYVKLPENQPLNFDVWVQGIKDGRSYVGDGMSHLFDFSVNGLGVGESGSNGQKSLLATRKGENLSISVKAAAMLEEQPREDIRTRPLSQKPYWHVERARVGNTRQVPVELIVNGYSVETKLIDANGTIQNLEFDYTPEKSSWVALRIFPSSHTNPVFVEVDEKPIRTSKKSAQWCLDAIDVCWDQKVRRIRPEEQEEAARAFESSRQAYRKILAESYDDR